MYEDFHVADRWSGEDLHCRWKGTVVAIATPISVPIGPSAGFAVTLQASAGGGFCVQSQTDRRLSPSTRRRMPRRRQASNA